MIGRMSGTWTLSALTVFAACLGLAATEAPGRRPLQSGTSASAEAAGTTPIFPAYTNYPVGSLPQAVATGDLNGDGRRDVVITTTTYFDPTNDYKVFVFLQTPSGELAAPVRYEAGGWASSVAVADLDHDGRDDVIVGDEGVMLRVFVQNGDGELAAPVDYPTFNSWGVAVGDFNSDGRMDVAGLGYTGGGWIGQVEVFLQTSEGLLGTSRTYTVDAYNSSVNILRAGDFNGDGLTDIAFVANATTPHLGVLLQSGGAFAAPVYGILPETFTAPSGLGIGDIGSDGIDDLILSNGRNMPGAKIAAMVLSSVGLVTTTATYTSYQCPDALALADVNCDGLADMVVLHGGWQKAGVYLQTATGAFDTEQLYGIPYNSHNHGYALAVDDITGDGMPDIVIADALNGLVVLRNRLPWSPRIGKIGLRPDGAVTLALPRASDGAPWRVILSEDLTATNRTELGTSGGGCWIDTNAAGRVNGFYHVSRH